MTIYISSSVPNAWIVGGCKVTPTTLQKVVRDFMEPNYYRDHDDHVAPSKWAQETVSVVGHQNTADHFTAAFTKATGAYYGGEQITFGIPMNRIQVIPKKGDKAIAGIFVPPRRLNEGEQWTEDDFLSNTKWVLVEF